MPEPNVRSADVIPGFVRDSCPKPQFQRQPVLVRRAIVSRPDIPVPLGPATPGGTAEAAPGPRRRPGRGIAGELNTQPWIRELEPLVGAPHEALHFGRQPVSCSGDVLASTGRRVGVAGSPRPAHRDRRVFS